MNLREQMEKDLSVTLEGEWGLLVELVGPDGIEITTSANSPDPLSPLPLKGQVLYSTVRVSPETGEDMIINNPIVVLRRSSLSRIPQDGEKWLVRIPEDPSLSAALNSYVFTPERASEGGRSIGFIRLYPKKVNQS
jgi:hypothetical protein